MSLFDHFTTALSHQETALAMLDSVIPWSERGKVAAAAGISREYFARLRRLDSHPPSPNIAERIARTVRLPPEQRDDLTTHLLQIDEELKGLEPIFNEDKAWLDTYAIHELTRAHHLATYSGEPQKARAYYQAIISLGKYLLNGFYHLGYELAAVRTHSLLQDAYCVLNRPGEGLYHAKMARLIANSVEREDLNKQHGLVYYDYDNIEHVIDYHNLQTNAIRIEAACYHTLGDHERAVRLCEIAQRTEAIQRDPFDLLPHILRDSINAAGQIPKTTVRDLEVLADKARAICEAKGDGVGLFLIQHTLAKAYLARRQTRQAQGVLAELQVMSDTVPIGQLHRSMFLSDLTLFHYLRGNKDGWATSLRDTLQMAKSAGLVHVLHSLMQLYGNTPECIKICQQLEIKAD